MEIFLKGPWNFGGPPLSKQPVYSSTHSRFRGCLFNSQGQSGRDGIRNSLIFRVENLNQNKSIEWGNVCLYWCSLHIWSPLHIIVKPATNSDWHARSDLNRIQVLNKGYPSLSHKSTLTGFANFTDSEHLSCDHPSPCKGIEDPRCKPLELNGPYNRKCRKAPSITRSYSTAQRCRIVCFSWSRGRILIIAEYFMRHIHL